MFKRLIPAMLVFSALIGGCGDDKDPNGPDGSVSPTAPYENDTTVIREILTANNLATLAVNRDIRWRDDIIYGKPRVTRLYLTVGTLGGAKLTTLSSRIGELTGLIELRLDSNLLAALPPEIGQLTNLVTLLARNNRLTSLPSQIGNLSSLATLKLGGNQLSSLPAQIGQLSELTIFAVEKNSLTSFADAWTGMSALRIFDFNQNAICVAPVGAVATWLSGIENLTGTDWAGTSWKAEYEQSCQ